jgi:hypothetical protein
MIKELAWDTFKKTGNINTFLELKQIQEAEKQIQKVDQNEYYKNAGDNNSRK